MDIIESLKKSKNGDIESVELIINAYKDYIYYQMVQYNIKDKITCYEEVRSRIIRAIFLFKI